MMIAIGVYKHKRTGREYSLMEMATDKTDSRDGSMMAVYCREGRYYVRDEAEFFDKFERIDEKHTYFEVKEKREINLSHRAAVRLIVHQIDGDSDFEVVDSELMELGLTPREVATHSCVEFEELEDNLHEEILEVLKNYSGEVFVEIFGIMNVKYVPRYYEMEAESEVWLEDVTHQELVEKVFPEPETIRRADFSV